MLSGPCLRLYYFELDSLLPCRPLIDPTGIGAAPTTTFREYLALINRESQVRSYETIYNKFCSQEHVDADELLRSEAPITRSDILALLGGLHGKTPFLDIDSHEPQVAGCEAVLSEGENATLSREIFDHLTERSRVTPLLAVLESDSSFYFVCESIAHSLRDILVFSTDIFAESNTTTLFVIFQIVRSLQALHSSGIVHGALNTHNILLEPSLFVWLDEPWSQQCMYNNEDSAVVTKSHDSRKDKTNNSSNNHHAPSARDHIMSAPDVSLRDAVQQW
jgi:serine/threonine protein kinase